MAIDDPKTRVRDTEPSMAQVLATMQELEKSRIEIEKQRQAIEAERLQLDRDRYAGEQDRANREMPENKQPTGISAFFTEADKAQYGTKPELRCKTIWAGREIYGDVETPEEITLINKLPHGDFRVTKANGQSMTFQVRHTTDSNGKLANVNVWFPCSKENRHDHGSITSYCRQALGVAEPTVAELTAELARLKAEMASNLAGMSRG